MLLVICVAQMLLLPCRAFLNHGRQQRFSMTCLYSERKILPRPRFLTRLNADTESKQLNLQSGYDTTDGYDSFLISPKKKRRNQRLSRKIKEEMDEDGYVSMMEGSKPMWQKVLLFPWKVGSRAFKQMTGRIPEPGTLILVRHVSPHFCLYKSRLCLINTFTEINHLFSG